MVCRIWFSSRSGNRHSSNLGGSWAPILGKENTIHTNHSPSTTCKTAQNLDMKNPKALEFHVLRWFCHKYKRSCIPLQDSWMAKKKTQKSAMIIICWVKLHLMTIIFIIYSEILVMSWSPWSWDVPQWPPTNFQDFTEKICRKSPAYLILPSQSLPSTKKENIDPFLAAPSRCE